MDIPEPAFDKNGQYDLSTPENRLAAAVATLRVIATMPQTYHSRGPEYVRDEMRKIALNLVEALRLYEEPPAQCDWCKQPLTNPAPTRGCGSPYLHAKR